MVNILMLDIETTGLNPHVDKILEIAAIPVQITKENGTQVSQERVNILIDEPMTLSALSPTVYKMHKESGLLDDLVNQPTYNIKAAESMLINLINNVFGSEAKNIQLGGNSVNFDLSFIKHHMPILAKRLSYRVMDMTPYRTMRNTLNGIKEDSPKHRALDDINYSISLLLELETAVCRRNL